MLWDVTLSMNSFKKKLDKLLELIPDNPRVPFLDPAPLGSHGRPSNSIRDWIPHLNLKSWTPIADVIESEIAE